MGEEVDTMQFQSLRGANKKKRKKEDKEKNEYNIYIYKERENI
jgi:hypothetical protein